jgi:hypothetical protein
MIVPERITLYCRKKDKDGVYHAFPVDSSNPNHDTAKSWAKESHGYWEDGSYIRVPGEEAKSFELDNQGFMNVKIESLDIRGQGGRAYQVILGVDDNKFRVDLREDTLMDVIRNTGIRAGGWLNGSFCFVKDGAQTKLIREGTELHKRAIAEREKRETFSKTISRKDLKPGHLYTTHSGDSKVFLGFVYTCDVDKDNGAISKPYKAMLFCSDYDPVKQFVKTSELKEDQHGYKQVSDYSFKLMKAHSFKIEGEKVVDVDLATAVSYIQKLAKGTYESKMTTQQYSRYPEEFIRPLALSGMAIDKKDVNIPAEEGKRIIRKVNEYTNRFGYRRW